MNFLFQNYSIHATDSPIKFHSYLHSVNYRQINTNKKTQSNKRKFWKRPVSSAYGQLSIKLTNTIEEATRNAFKQIIAHSAQIAFDFWNDNHFKHIFKLKHPVDWMKAFRDMKINSYILFALIWLPCISIFFLFHLFCC